jgi:hypothetical protein
MSLFPSMLRKWSAWGSPALSCPYCCETLQRSQVYFRCRDVACRKPQNGVDVRRAGGRTVFRPDQYDEEVACYVPDCRKPTVLKICPNCWNDLPVIPGQSEFLTIAGLRGAGKTYYTTALIHAIGQQLGRMDNYRMTAQFADDAGRKYFADRKEDIVIRGAMPTVGIAESKDGPVQTPAIQVIVRFPRWRAGRLDPRELGIVSLVFQDPAGEWFRNFASVHQIQFLKNTRSLMVLVNPLTIPGFVPTVPQPRPRGEPETGDAGEIDDPTIVLQTLAQKLRVQMRLGQKKRIPKDVAVVITKTDCGVFGDPCLLDSFPRQQAPYNPDLTDEISQFCRARLARLGMDQLINQAEHNFETVRFFGVSALGTTPRSDGGVAERSWEPQRVEDPFLWILHRWNLI